MTSFFKNTSLFLMIAFFGCVMCDAANAARTAIRGTAATRRTSATTQTTPSTVATSTTDVVEEEPEKEPEIIENKASQFDSFLNEVSSDEDMSAASLAEQIRKQRAAAEARDNAEYIQSKQQTSLTGGKNVCDNGLRTCMQRDCGSDFSKCALDGDTLFGDKLNKCRRETTCSGEEFKLFTAEIKADRDMNARLSSYTSVIDCGNQYNACIQNECGTTFGKCLGKTAADRATKACEQIAKRCIEQDSGLAGRFGTVIGRLREHAEIDVKTDETRMYKLRDLMKNQCTKLGAMFDERSFDCVYTVNFFAGENQQTPIASRKVYAGDSFVCMQEWFGVNVTTYRENAYRETRAQTGASSAMLGSGVGTAVGLISSGAIGRALDTQKAKKALDAAEKAGALKDQESNGDEDQTRNNEAAKNNCERDGGEWTGDTCDCKDDRKTWDRVLASCEDKEKVKQDQYWDEKKAACEEKIKTNKKCRWDSQKGECPCDGDTGKPNKKDVKQAVSDINKATKNLSVGDTLQTPKDLSIRNDPDVKAAIEKWWKKCKTLPMPNQFTKSITYTLAAGGVTQCVVESCVSSNYVINDAKTACIQKTPVTKTSTTVPRSMYTKRGVYDDDELDDDDPHSDFIK